MPALFHLLVQLLFLLILHLRIGSFRESPEHTAGKTRMGFGLREELLEEERVYLGGFMWTRGSTGTHGLVCLQSQCVWEMELNNFDLGAPILTSALELG